jgi:pyruvate kinase
MQLPDHKTKIVCTIGPASRSETILKELLQHGMNVARLNFSHGTFEEHREDIQMIRAAAAELQQNCLIFADLPGPKIRIGNLQQEPLVIKKGDALTLTTRDVLGTADTIPVSYTHLPESVAPDSIIYLNDGFIQLKVQEVIGQDVRCCVLIGGSLRSHKGLNLPNAKMFVEPITEQDLDVVEFCLREQITTFGVSFIEQAADLIKVKDFARKRGAEIQVIAKIERIEAVKNITEILDVADAIMVARGDLGVETPIEDIPGIQKRLIHEANLRGCPVITATQMLESMTQNIRPTRAEATDVANAILDGADAVMLSEETAIGKYPVETVAMMARIAASIERQREAFQSAASVLAHFKEDLRQKQINVENVIALSVMDALASLPIHYILTPTRSGQTPRCISRFKPEAWILAFTESAQLQQFLTLSYGVLPFLHDTHNGCESMLTFVRNTQLAQAGDQVIITEGIAAGHTGWTNSFKILTL